MLLKKCDLRLIIFEKKNCDTFNEKKYRYGPYKITEKMSQIIENSNKNQKLLHSTTNLLIGVSGAKVIYCLIG